MTVDDWDSLMRGQDCSFCGPEDDITKYGFRIADLSVSTLWLTRDQTYGGCCILAFTARHATGIEQVTDQEYAAVTTDLRRAALAITAALKPDHMNYATLGNSILHLHWHIIPRYRTDPRWRTNPFWRPGDEPVRLALEDE